MKPGLKAPPSGADGAVVAVTQAVDMEGAFDPAQIRSAYQPIVDLEHGDVVAVEALARWPGLGITPDVAFGHARQTGRLDELDRACQHAALVGLRGAHLPAGFAVFVNVEPGSPVSVLIERSTGPRIFAEITERALLHDPAGLLRSVHRMREQGCGIALDDVGAVPDSLALLPLVAPEVIKLDISLVQGWPDAGQARILTAVAAYAEQSGATILAEGIETARDHDQALALGATLGQGWYFARPGPLAHHVPPVQPVALGAAAVPTHGTPFQLVDPRRLRIGSKGTLLAISHHIEQQGMKLETPPLLLGAFQESERFTPATAERYRHLARRCSLTVALGAGMRPEPAPGVRGADLSVGDELRCEWTVAVVGTHYAGALIAKDLGDSGPDLERRYLFTLTHDHHTVLAAARRLLDRVEPLGRGGCPRPERR